MTDSETVSTINEPKVLNINVGILGHVDSGKTSLVKALSTTLSTAALDKHPQSQQRGITLDLGFSAFTLPIPERLRAENILNDEYDVLQFTLVDCPGHASLIRTIIGGAQIIDMIVLVVDVTKGIQTQTAECVVIGEITSDHLMIALNKIDLLPESERAERILKMTRRIRRTLAGSKFADAEIVPVSAVIGGEKIAATTSTSNSSHKKSNTIQIESLGMSELISKIIDLVQPRKIIELNDFYFAIDHCFQVKGHGTVLTGTVLSGSVHINQMLDIPNLGPEGRRKVKSMQMFRRPVRHAVTGDRLGICVPSLDAKLLERGFACSIDSVPTAKGVVCLIRKVRFFRRLLKSGSKIHVTIGHQTLLATVTFFGGGELNQLLVSSASTTAVAASREAASIVPTTTIVAKNKAKTTTDDSNNDDDSVNDNDSEKQEGEDEDDAMGESGAFDDGNNNDSDDEKAPSSKPSAESIASAATNAAAPPSSSRVYDTSFPTSMPFNSTSNYQLQDSLHDPTVAPLQYCLIMFPHVIHIPPQALIIAARLDDTHTASGSSSKKSKRLL